MENCEIYNCSTAIYDKGRSSGSVFRDNYTSVSDWQVSGKLVGRENPGEGSLDCSPGFVNSSGSFERLDDFRLADDSPCRGAGRDGKDMGADVERVGLVAE